MGIRNCILTSQDFYTGCRRIQPWGFAMEYRYVQTHESAESTVRDSITIDDGLVKHFQVERKGDRTFMRLKTRKLAVSR